MTIREHCRPLTILAQILGTDVTDCAAYVEEFVTEMRSDGESEEDAPTFSKLGDNMYPSQMDELTDQILGHYYHENQNLDSQVKALLYNLSVN